MGKGTRLEREGAGVWTQSCYCFVPSVTPGGPLTYLCLNFPTRKISGVTRKSSFCCINMPETIIFFSKYLCARQDTKVTKINKRQYLLLINSFCWGNRHVNSKVQVHKHLVLHEHFLVIKYSSNVILMAVSVVSYICRAFLSNSGEHFCLLNLYPKGEVITYD